MTPEEALNQLMDGNKRYVADRALYANHSADRRDVLASGQSPFAIILGCSDSRVAPEIIFDQGLGDLFIVRVAGNIAGPLELDSIDYSAKYLGSSLILVLGHEACGAVEAVKKGVTEDIRNVAKKIRPAIKGAKNLEQAIKDSVRNTVAYLRKSRLIGQLIKEGSIDCIGGYYNLRSGQVELLEN